MSASLANDAASFSERIDTKCSVKNKRNREMILWVQRSFSKGMWGAVQDLFAKHFMALGGPIEMILVHVDHEDWRIDKLILGLPDKAKALLPLYAGFEEIAESQLPEVATLLEGRVTTFERWFRYKNETCDA